MKKDTVQTKNKSGGSVYVGKKEYRSAIRSRELIREAMLGLVCEKSLNDITIKEVVDKARINRSTFYAHYGNLGDLLEEIEGELLEQMVEQYNRYYGSTFSAETVARLTIQLFDDFPQYKRGKNINASFAELVQRVLNQFIDLCLLDVPKSQKEDPAYRAEIQLVVMFIYYSILNCDNSSWKLNLPYGRACEEILNLCKKL